MREGCYENFRNNLKLFTLRDISDSIINKCSAIPKDIEEIGQAILEQDADKLYSLLLVLIENIKESDNVNYGIFLKEINDIPYSTYDWYFDLRKYGNSNTAGFGLGLERFISWLSGDFNIKNVCMFPRFDGRLKP